MQTVKDHVLKIKIGTAVAVTTAILVSVFGSGVGFQKIWSRLDHLNAKTALYQVQFDDLENRVSTNEKDINSNYKEIITKLEFIIDRVK